jgi:phosphoglycerate dehydrogenase-like enzyme
MKIAFVHSEKEFNDEFFQELKSRLIGHELVSWEAGEQPPANDFEVIVVMGKFTAEQMATQSKLRLIQTASAGYDGIDVEAATKKGILVAYAPSGETGNAISVAEFAMLLILGASRSLNQVFQPAQAGNAPGISKALYGKTVCIIGLGEIGHLLAGRLRPFGVKLRATDDHPKEVPDGLTLFHTSQMKEAFSGADYVVLCVRATSENENLINAEAFKALKKGTILVNIARGSLVDEQALAEALKSGHIAYVGLDVVKNEPVKPDDPLLNFPQAFVTPHVAGTTDLTLRGTVDYVSRVVEEFSKGKKPEALVKKEV